MPAGPGSTDTAAAAQHIDGSAHGARAPQDEDGQAGHDRGREDRSQQGVAMVTLRLQRRVGNADVEHLDVGAPQRLAEPFQEKGEADGGHEQDDLLLVDHVSQDHPLDGEGERQHDQAGEHDGEQQRHAALHQADQRQRRKQHHHALREIEDARGLVDQHEAQRDQRVHHARQDAADDDLAEEQRPGQDRDPGLDQEVEQEIHALSRRSRPLSGSRRDRPR